MSKKLIWMCLLMATVACAQRKEMSHLEQEPSLCDKITHDVQRAADVTYQRSLEDGEISPQEMKTMLNDRRMWKEMMANNGCDHNKIIWPLFPASLCKQHVEDNQRSICDQYDAIAQDGQFTYEERQAMMAREIMAVKSCLGSGCDTTGMYFPIPLSK